MRDSLPTDLLLRLMSATPEQYAAVERVLGMRSEDGRWKMEDGKAREDTRPTAPPRNLFRRVGSHWEVGFGGARMHVEDTLGARYVDYLLHRPGEVISAFDLEVAILPEKAAVRARDSIQTQLDSETTRSYLRELARLRTERERVSEDGDQARAEGYDEEIAALEEALQGDGRTTSDTGERARNNVRKAVRKFIARLERGERRERGFAEHLTRCVSLGFQVSYQPMGGQEWE
jgi:hypothetical protein